MHKLKLQHKAGSDGKSKTRNRLTFGLTGIGQ